MYERALPFGVAAGPGSKPRKACRVEFDLIGVGAGGVDEGLDVNVHGFGLRPISINLAPPRSRGALPYLEERGRERGRPRRGRRLTEIGVPDCFISVTQIIQSLHELGVDHIRLGANEREADLGGMRIDARENEPQSTEQRT